MAKFISDGVGVHSIEDTWPIPAGWDLITEAEARKISADLFGGEAAAPAKKTPTETSK